MSVSKRPSGASKCQNDFCEFASRKYFVRNTPVFSISDNSLKVSDLADMRHKRVVSPIRKYYFRDAKRIVLLSESSSLGQQNYYSCMLKRLLSWQRNDDWPAQGRFPLPANTFFAPHVFLVFIFSRDFYFARIYFYPSQPAFCKQCKMAPGCQKGA